MDTVRCIVCKAEPEWGDWLKNDRLCPMCGYDPYCRKGGSVIRFCVRCEEQIKEEESVAELEKVAYHVPCLITDLMEQVNQRDDTIKLLEQELGRRAK